MKRDKEVPRSEDMRSGEDDSSSSEDDENAELLTEEVEEGFFKVLSQLKKKDSKLYEESMQFFQSNISTGGDYPDVKKNKSKEESLIEFREWLKGQKEKVKNKEVKEDLEALHDFWTSPNLNNDERFLRDYILNKKFLEPDDNFNVEEEITKLSDEEKEFEEQLQFEHRYNCRFENSDKDMIMKENSKCGNVKIKEENVISKPENEEVKHSDFIFKIENNEESIIDTNRKNRKRKRSQCAQNDNSFEGVPVKKMNKQNSQHTLPRNLEMKNKKGKIKMRHRNMKKLQYANNVSVKGRRNEEESSLSTVGFHQNNRGKKLLNSLFGLDSKTVNRCKNKKNKTFQNIIVKERKNRKRYGKVHSKKQKAAAVLGKR